MGKIFEKKVQYSLDMARAAASVNLKDARMKFMQLDRDRSGFLNHNETRQLARLVLDPYRASCDLYRVSCVVSLSQNQTLPLSIP